MEFGQDKVKHLIAGFIIVLIAVIFLKPKQALTLSTVIAAGKEAYDAPSAGNADLFDFLATILGITIGFTVAMLLRCIWRIFGRGHKGVGT